MSRHLTKRGSRRLKSQSLIAAGKINPIQWDISKGDAAQALKNVGIPVKEVKKVHCLKHQVCVSYWDVEGKVCCSFFSYRIFDRWLEAVENAIEDCQTIAQWDSLSEIIEYELVQFNYPVKMANQIWDKLKKHWYQLVEGISVSEKLTV